MKKSILLISAFVIFTDLLADDIPVNKDSIVMSYTADEVVIQAFKRNDDIQMQPISATVINDQVIKDRNIANIKDITAFVPNLFIPDYGSKMTSPAYIRGIGSRINAPSVGLYVDGVPYFDRSTFDFNINDIDRIEVLRGPQGTIYGRNTMGGIINVYTKSPFKYKETNMNLTAGNYNNYQVNASHYGNIKNKFGYSFSGNYQHFGGFFTNTFTGKKADLLDALSGRIRLSWNMSQKLRAHLISSYEYSDQDGYPYARYNDKTRELEKVGYDAHSYYRRNMSTNGLTIEYLTEYFKLNSLSSFQYFDGKQGIDQDFTPQDLYYVNFYQRQQMYSQEFNFKSINNSWYKWQFGLFGFRQNYYNTNDVDKHSTPTSNTLKSVSTPASGFALYHQSTFDNVLTDGLSFVLGLRYDWEKDKLKSKQISTVGGKDPVQMPADKEDVIFRQLTPKASVQYTFTNDDLIYFSVAKGYKAGGFNTTVAERPEDKTFDPEHSWSYELGTKSSYLDKLIYTELSLFYIRWSDQQVSQTQPSGKGFLLRNAGKSISKGFEISTHINPLKDLSLQVNYGYTHAKFKEYEDEIKKINYTGNYLPMVPLHTLSLTVDYTLWLKGFWLEKIRFNAQYNGVGKLYWNEDNVAIQPYYGTFNGQVSFIKNSYSLDFWMKNIGNKNYTTYYFKSMGNTFAQRGKPFSCGVNINLKF